LGNVLTSPAFQVVGLGVSLVAAFLGVRSGRGVALLVAAGGVAGSVYFLGKLSDFALSPPPLPAGITVTTENNDGQQ
jgi:hypothetical protein